MAKLGTAFITGANAKIKIGNAVIAYCTDVSYNINVQTIPVETMGKYEVHSNEPVAYAVDGTFSILRYTKNTAEGTEIKVVDEKGNEATETSTITSLNATGNGAAATPFKHHLDPKNILVSATFDFEIFEKRDTGDNAKAFFKVTDCRITRRGATLNKRNVLVDSYAFVGVLAGDFDLEDSLAVAASEAGGGT